MNDKIAQFRFELEDGSPLILTYNLQPNSLTPKWIDIVNNRKTETPQSTVKKFLTGNSFSTEPLELKITNKTRQDIPMLTNKLNEISNKINLYYDIPLPVFTSHTEVDHKILNFLHEEFERYGERHRIISAGGYRNLTGDPTKFPGTEFKVEFHQLWLDLNQWIHITESALDSPDWPNFSCLVQYTPFVEHGAPITGEDKLFLHNRFTWGSLYLGYNTLGKDYEHAFHDNDQRVIANNQVKVQQWMSSEVWLNFSKDQVEQPHRAKEYQFWRWYKTLSPDLQANIPINEIDTLALGRYYLGTISFDNAFLDFHPVEADWYVPNSDIRDRWNREVFGKIVKVTGIKILND